MTRDVFNADLARFETAILADHAAHNSRVTYDDDTVTIDPEKTRLPAEFLATYQGLLSVGYANGFI